MYNWGLVEGVELEGERVLQAQRLISHEDSIMLLKRTQNSQNKDIKCTHFTTSHIWIMSVPKHVCYVLFPSLHPQDVAET